MIRVRYGARASHSSKVMSSLRATSAKATRSSSALICSAPVPGTEKSMRMKNRPVSWSPNCWLSMMLPP